MKAVGIMYPTRHLGDKNEMLYQNRLAKHLKGYGIDGIIHAMPGEIFFHGNEESRKNLYMALGEFGIGDFKVSDIDPSLFSDRQEKPAVCRLKGHIDIAETTGGPVRKKLRYITSQPFSCGINSGEDITEFDRYVDRVLDDYLEKSGQPLDDIQIRVRAVMGFEDGRKKGFRTKPGNPPAVKTKLRRRVSRCCGLPD